MLPEASFIAMPSEKIGTLRRISPCQPIFIVVRRANNNHFGTGYCDISTPSFWLCYVVLHSFWVEQPRMCKSQ